MLLSICVAVFSAAADAVVLAGGMVDGDADGVVAGGVVVLGGSAGRLVGHQRAI